MHRVLQHVVTALLSDTADHPPHTHTTEHKVNESPALTDLYQQGHLQMHSAFMEQKCQTAAVAAT